MLTSLNLLSYNAYGTVYLYNQQIYMRKEIIKILQKPHPYPHHQHYHTQYSDTNTHPTHQYQHSITHSSSIQTRQELQIDKIKKFIETATIQQSKTLLTKVKAVQRLTTSAQKRRQCPRSKKQRSNKLTDTTQSCPNHSQNIKTVLNRVDDGGVKKDYEQLLEMQIELLSEQINSLKQQKETINKQAQLLKYQNQRLKVLLDDREAQIINQRTNSEQMINQLNSERSQLQAQIYHLIEQNPQNKLKDIVQHNLTMCGQTLKLAVIGSQQSKIVYRGRNMQVQFINLQKKYSTAINQLKAQHQDEIAKLRKIMFDNINYYRTLTKNSSNYKAGKFQPQLQIKQSRQDAIDQLEVQYENWGR